MARTLDTGSQMLQEQLLENFPYQLINQLKSHGNAKAEGSRPDPGGSIYTDLGKLLTKKQSFFSEENSHSAEFV